MRTPEGRECPYYYADVQRWHVGKAECRLLEGKPDAARWTAALCASCPVPDIRRANACPQMILEARIGRRPLRFWERPRMLVRASCTRTHGPVADPYVGCGRCHETLNFVVADEEAHQK